MTVSGKLYTPPQYHKSLRSLIAAKYTNSNVVQCKYVPGVTDKDKEFTSNFPKPACPAFLGKEKILFETNAISHYLGNEKLRGGSNEKLVNEWISYTDSTILPSVGTWVYNDLKICEVPKDIYGKARANVNTLMRKINDYLAKVTYLVGETITQADITLFTVVQLLFFNVYDENNRKSVPHLNRWFMTVANQKEVLAVCGKPVLYMKPSETVKKVEKAPAAKKQEKKVEEPKPEKKKEDKLAKLDKGTFDMDEWKRMFSNNDLDKVALPWFMEKFDPERYSVWYCVYNYPQDLGLIFQSNNLIGGMFQRLEGIKKMAFAGQHVFGKDKDNMISGVWFWRGTGLIFELDEDLQTDYESYTWKKIDPKKPEDFKLMRDHWKKEGTYHERPYADGKIYK